MKKLFKYFLIAIILFIGLFIVVSIIAPSSSTTETKVEVKTTESPVAKSEPEHDQEYSDTRMKIYNFLENKRYDVKTDFGVPRIVKTDADLGEDSEGWIATVNYNGKETDFSVVLFNGEVSAIKPIK